MGGSDELWGVPGTGPGQERVYAGCEAGRVAAGDKSVPQTGEDRCGREDKLVNKLGFICLAAIISPPFWMGMAWIIDLLGRLHGHQ
jgi:hypothetical protein